MCVQIIRNLPSLAACHPVPGSRRAVVRWPSFVAAAEEVAIQRENTDNAIFGWMALRFVGIDVVRAI